MELVQGMGRSDYSFVSTNIEGLQLASHVPLVRAGSTVVGAGRVTERYLNVLSEGSNCVFFEPVGGGVTN